MARMMGGCARSFTSARETIYSANGILKRSDVFSTGNFCFHESAFLSAMPLTSTRNFSTVVESFDSTGSDPSLSLSETMRRVLSLENASQEEKNLFKLRQVVKDYQLHSTDTGINIIYLILARLQMRARIHSHETRPFDIFPTQSLRLID